MLKRKVQFFPRVTGHRFALTFLNVSWSNNGTLSKDHTANTMPTKTTIHMAAHTYVAHIWEYFPTDLLVTSPDA